MTKIRHFCCKAHTAVFRGWVTHVELLSQIPFDGETRIKEWELNNINQYKTAFSFWYGPFLSCVELIHPSTVKILLKTEEPKQFSDNTGYNLLLSWLGKACASP